MRSGKLRLFRAASALLLALSLCLGGCSQKKELSEAATTPAETETETETEHGRGGHHRP